jgi:hypothetical protein
MKRIVFTITILITISLFAFRNSNNLSAKTTHIDVPAVYYKIYGATSLTNDGTYITVKSNGVPDHVSPYYANTNYLYQTYAGTTPLGYTFVKNPNTIAAQTFTFKIPLNPTVATNHATTPLGPIGVALNGVPLYNQYAGPNQPLTNEIASFDKYNGHPQATGQYHYHVEPLYLTNVTASKTGLLGFLLDGFPVYGPQETTSWQITPTGSNAINSTLISSNLDVYHGHTHATPDFPNGIYHYHFTADAPYLNGNGYYGTAGTVTQ